MNRPQFTLTRMMVGVALTALACAAARITSSFAGWLPLPSLGAILLVAWAAVILGRRESVGLMGFAYGAAGGWLLEVFAIRFAGAGHGTYLPLQVFFSPLFLVWAASKSDLLNITILAGAPLLHALYGAAVAKAAQKHWGPACFISILMFHYGCLAISIFVGVGDDASSFRKTFETMRWWIIVAATFFVGLHVATVVFLVACRRWYRRREPML